MKTLLAKIHSAKPAQKCQLAAEVHGHVTMVLQNLEKQVDQTTPADLSTTDITTFDQTLDEIEAALNELEALLSGLDSQEITRIRENIEKDYNETLELWKFYEILNSDGKTYTADYDGRAEAGNHGKNSPAGPDFTGQKFEIPTLAAILTRLKPAQMKLYRQMEKEGLAPKLQITPIAYNIRTLSKKIDAKKAQLKINTNDTYVWEDIKDEELQYAPTIIKAVKGGKEIEIKGGKTKSEWIKANGGFLIDIVPTKEALAADDSIQKDQRGQVNYNAIQAEKYAAKTKQEGFTPLSYESYLLAQMRAVKAGKPLEDWNKSSTYSLLLDSNLNKSQVLANGRWDDDLVNLNWNLAGNRSVDVRVRSSVRVL